MSPDDLIKMELYFVVGAVLYLIYTKVEKHFPTMSDVDSRLTYAAIFFLWPIMVVVLFEEYVRGRRKKEDQ